MSYPHPTNSLPAWIRPVPFCSCSKRPGRLLLLGTERENPHRTPTQQRWCGGGMRVPLLELINYLSFGDSNTERGEPQEKWPKGTISVHSVVTTLGTSEINGAERKYRPCPQHITNVTARPQTDFNSRNLSAPGQSSGCKI